MEKIKTEEKIVENYDSLSPTSKDYNKRFDDLPEIENVLSELNFLTENKIKCDKIINYKENDKIYCFDKSIDKIVVNNVNNELSEEFIKRFNEVDEYGSKESKKIAIKIFNNIKEVEFRESVEGRVVYREFRRLHDLINVNNIKLNECINYDNNILENTFSYLLISCDLNKITTISELSKEMNNLLGSTNAVIYQEVNFIEKNNDINENSKKDIVEMIKNKNDEIDIIEENKRSYGLRVYRYIYSCGKIIFSMDPVSAGFASCVLGTGIYFGGKFILDSELIKVKKNEISSGTFFENKMNVVNNNEESPVKEAFKTLFYRVGEYLFGKEND